MSYESGRITGQILVYVIFFWAALKCFSIARRPTTNGKCAVSLGLFFCSFTVAGLCGTAGQNSPNLKVIIVVGTLMAFAGFISSIVLAIVGLVEYSGHDGKYVQGRAQAIWTLSLSFIFLCIGGVNFFHGFTQGLHNKQNLAANQPGANQSLTFEDFNFKFRAPGKPWVQLDAKKFNKNATAAFAQMQPEVYFMIIAEKGSIGPSLTTESVVEIAKANLRSKMDSLQILEERPMQRQGLDGMQLDTTSQTQSTHLFYRDWVCVTNGYIYQLIAWGKLDDEGIVRTKSDELYAAFSVMDPNRHAAKSGATVSDFNSDLFHYTVKIAGLNWRPSSIIAKSVPTADSTFWNGDENVGLFVVPVYLTDQDPLDDAWMQAMVATVLGVSFPGTDIHDKKAVSQSGLAGVEFGVEREGNDGKLIYRVKLFKGSQDLYLVAAYYLQQQKDESKTLEEALDRVEFDNQGKSASNVVQQFSERDRRRHGLVFNEMGIFYYNARQFEKSAVYFQTAFQFEQKSPIFLANVANAYSSAGKKQEALNFLEDNPALLATNQSVRATQAYLQLQLERADDALANFRTLFDEGYRNDNYFVEYIKLLEKVREQQMALTAVENYLKGGDSAAVRILEARLYTQKKDYPKAIALLKEQCLKYPYNSEVSFALADAYTHAGSYAEAVAVCQQLIDAQNDSAGVYYLKGSGEFGLKRYREAKASFEAALKKDPASASTKSYLDLVSGMLGEGSNSAVKDTIAPVPIPENLINTPAPEASASYTKDFGARYLKDITAISFVKKAELKHTDFVAIKVLDSSGLAAFTTIQCGFDPLIEAIFVNDLKVKNENGEVVATGKVDDYYVVDAASKTAANQKKVLNIPVSGLRSGYTIELMVTRKDLAPPAEFPFTAHTCLNSFPMLEDIFLIRGDTNALKFAGVGAENGIKNEDGLYWVRQQPDVYKWEPMEESPLDFEPTLYIGDSTATWNGEAKKYLEQISDYLQVDPGVRELADKLTATSRGKTEKILSLARYAQTNYTYKAIEFGRRARVPHKTSQILHNQYGDCKDHSLLLQQMLEACGVRAQLALVKSIGKICKELPSLDQFDHMIVYLPEFRNGFFIDCTDKGSDLAQTTPYGLAGKEAFILDATNPRFITMPEYPDDGNTVDSRREVQITNGTDVVVHETLSLRGCNATALRSYFKQLQPSARRSFVDLQLNRQSGEVTSFKLENLEDTQAPLVLDLDYFFKGQFHPTGNKLVGKLPDVWEQLYASADPVEKRTKPFELDVPVNVDSAITLDIPRGYREPQLKDFHQDLQLDFASTHSDAKRQGTEVKIDYRLHRRSGKFAAADYPPYRENMLKALRPLEQTIAFTKSP